MRMMLLKFVLRLYLKVQRTNKTYDTEHEYLNTCYEVIIMVGDAYTTISTEELIRRKHNFIREIEELDYEISRRNQSEVKRLRERIFGGNKMSDEDNVVEQPVETPAEAPVETPAETPAEAPAEPAKEAPKKTGGGRGRGVQADSYTSHNLAVLADPAFTSLQACVDEVDKRKPGRDKKKIEAQMNTMLYMIKKQSPARWTKYAFDEEKFLLTTK